jgi:hypothetical protein
MKVVEAEIAYGSRPPSPFVLSLQDADFLITKGFDLEVYDKGQNLFVLRPPFDLGRDVGRGMWIIAQVIQD